jgi:hypothetical protein
MEPIRLIDIDGGKFYQDLHSALLKACRIAIDTGRSVSFSAKIKVILDKEDNTTLNVFGITPGIKEPDTVRTSRVTIVDDDFMTQEPLSKEATQLVLNFTGVE